MLRMKRKLLSITLLLLPATAAPAVWLAASPQRQVRPAQADARRAGSPRPSYSVRFLSGGEWARLASDNLVAGDAEIDERDLPRDVQPDDLLPPIDGTESATIDENARFAPTVQPDNPTPQRPPLSTPENVDTGRPVHEWQRATDDWAGLRPGLEDRGLAFNANLTAEYAKNLRGGLNTNGGDGRHLLNANLTLNTERLFGLPGGTAFVNVQQQHGQEGFDVGDAQGYTNIDADGRTQISELWYEQLLFGNKLRLKAGKIDANTEFAFVENGAEFINSSMGFSPTILGLPTYPDPSFGALVFLTPCDAFYAGAGAFDGAAQEGVPTGSRGPKTLFDDPADLFLIGEAGTKWSLAGGRGGRIGLGLWHHTGTFERFDGGAESGTTGFYAVADQTLWRENPPTNTDDGEEADDSDTQGIGLYLQYGYADPDVSEIAHHVGTGLAWQGVVPGRDDDVLGLGVSHVLFSDNGAGFGHDAETAVELFYKLQLTPWASVKPDVQYVRHPGGDAGVDDALVFTVRAVIDF